jgi:hypothetical protein
MQYEIDDVKNEICNLLNNQKGDKIIDAIEALITLKIKREEWKKQNQETRSFYFFDNKYTDGYEDCYLVEVSHLKNIDFPWYQDKHKIRRGELCGEWCDILEGLRKDNLVEFIHHKYIPSKIAENQAYDDLVKCGHIVIN